MKIFIVSHENIDRLAIANNIVALNDDLNICKSFTTEQSNGLIGEYLFYLDEEDIVLSFRNNALLYIDYNNENISGITIDDFDMSSIIPMTMKHFNAIPDYLLKDKEILIIWLESRKIQSNDRKKELIESNFVQERIDSMNIPMLYFCDEDTNDIAKTIIEYYLGDNETREELILENS